MKRVKKLCYLMLAFLLVSAAAFAAIKLTPDDTVIDEEDTGTSIYTVDTASVTELAWASGEETIALILDEENWNYAEDADFPLDQSIPESMLGVVADIYASKTIEGVEDLSQYGLDEPQLTVTVTAEDATEFLIGDETSMGGEYYLSLGDGNVYLVDSTLLDGFAYELYDMVEMESIPAISDVTAVMVKSELGALSIEYLPDSDLSYSTSHAWFAKDGEDYVTLGTTETETLLDTITTLSWTACVDYNAADLSAYGLDAPSAVVSIDYTQTVTVETSETDEDGNATTEEQENPTSFTLEIGDYADTGSYARISGSSMVYIIDSTIGDTLLYTDLVSLLPGEVLSMDWDAVTGIDVTLDGAIYSITKSVETSTDEEDVETEETVYAVDGAQVETDAVQSILDSLDALVSSGSESGLTPERSEEIRFVFYQEHETWPQVELVFYQYDSSNCLVSLNDETRLFVARADIVSLVETANTLLLQ